MSRSQLNPLHGDQLSKSDATQMVRREATKCAREQGGSQSASNYGSDETALPAGDASSDIADASRNSGGSGMGHALGEWQYRDDQEHDNRLDY